MYIFILSVVHIYAQLNDISCPQNPKTPDSFHELENIFTNDLFNAHNPTITLSPGLTCCLSNQMLRLFRSAFLDECLLHILSLSQCCA